MTVNLLIRKAADILSQAEIENAQNEARWIFESCFENARELMFFKGNEEIDSAAYLNMISERTEGRPLQYVIGSWNFFGEEFLVGEGVLIPRPETEMLVEFAQDYLKNKKNQVVVDLCSGSGCIGISVARIFPDAEVYLVEKSEEALSFLRKNVEKSGCRNITVVHGDAFLSPSENGISEFDLLLSNPPYIPSGEIDSLQSEVQFEPKMALDGGNDGLDFYRIIAEKWLPFCKGAICIECGEGQTNEIENIFSKYCKETYPQADFQNILRTVCGIIR